MRATCLAQIQKNATNKQTKGYKRQLNLVKLVLATPSKSKQCMIMLVPFDFRLAGLAHPWNTKAAEAKPVPNFWSSAMMPCATSKTATKLFARCCIAVYPGVAGWGWAWQQCCADLTCIPRWHVQSVGWIIACCVQDGLPPLDPHQVNIQRPRHRWAPGHQAIEQNRFQGLEITHSAVWVVGQSFLVAAWAWWWRYFCRAWELNLPQTCCSSYKVLPVSAGTRFVVMRCGVSV